MSAKLRKLTVVLCGKTGNGRSSTGNTLLGQSKFDAGFSTKGVTENVQRETCRKTTEKYDVEMDVVDTPGMFDRGKFEKNALQLVDIENMNPDVFLLVLHGGARFTEEEQLTVDLIRIVFGDNVFKHTIIIVTCGDNFGNNELFYKFLKDSQDVQKLMELCGERVLKIENASGNLDWETFLRFTDEIKTTATFPYKNNHSNMLREILKTYFHQNREGKTVRTQLKEIRVNIAKKIHSWKRPLLIGGVVVVCGALLYGGAYLVLAAGRYTSPAVAPSTIQQAAPTRVIVLPAARAQAQSSVRAPVQTQAFKK